MNTCTVCGHPQRAHGFAGCYQPKWAGSSMPRLCSCRCYVAHTAPASARRMPRWSLTRCARSRADHPVWRVAHLPMASGDELWAAIPPGPREFTHIHWFPTWREAFDYAHQQATTKP